MNTLVQSQIEGVNPVVEALRAGRRPDRILIARRDHGGSMAGLLDLAGSVGIPVINTTTRYLDRLSITGRHQGVIAMAAPVSYVDLEDVLAANPARDNPLLVICDGIQDPGNLGAILRVADGAGVCAVIVPQRRSAGLTEGTLKSSAGAAEHVLVVQVTNLVRTIKRLQQVGFWVVGCEGDGECELYDVDFCGPLAVVVGGEAKGLARLTRETCDVVMRIPLFGQLNSLNVATASAVVLFEAIRQRYKA